jgi:hypothetical protein
VQERAAQADSPLPQLTSEQADRRLDFGRSQASEQLRKALDFGGARADARYLSRCGDQLDELHEPR